MRVVRIRAVYEDHEGDSDEISEFTLICGLDENGSILRQEWMGYTRNGTAIWPFILVPNKGELRFGENYLEPCDIEGIRVDVGAVFQIKSKNDSEKPWKAQYHIVEVFDPLLASSAENTEPISSN